MTRRSWASRALLGAGASAAGLASASVDGRSRPQLLRRPYSPQDGSGEREHYLYLPVGFHTEAGRRWPVLLFLHGNGERGNGREDLKYTMIHGPLMEAWVQARDLPFLIVQPQLDWYTRPKPDRRGEPPVRRADGPPPPRNAGPRPSEEMVRRESGQEPRYAPEPGPPEGWEMVGEDLLAIVDATVRDFRGDPERVYVTGLSYGGFGTWHLASAWPDRWAAAAPICGAGDAKKVQAIADAKLPIWIFQGGRDVVVRAEWVLATARALEAAGHPEVRMTVHEDLGHNVWTRVYEGRDLYDWFLQQRREKPEG